jgi:membrane protein DedA with SNARE-associated domain
MFDWLLQLIHQLYDVRGLIEWGDLLMLTVIVFAETGLRFGFFLPGDSLLVTALRRAGTNAGAAIKELEARLVGSLMYW